MGVIPRRAFERRVVCCCGVRRGFPGFCHFGGCQQQSVFVDARYLFWVSPENGRSCCTGRQFPVVGFRFVGSVLLGLQ